MGFRMSIEEFMNYDIRKYERARATEQRAEELKHLPLDEFIAIMSLVDSLPLFDLERMYCRLNAPIKNIEI